MFGDGATSGDPEQVYQEELQTAAGRLVSLLVSLQADLLLSFE